MANSSLQLHEYPSDMVHLSCAKCGGAGQYRKQFLLAVLAILAGTIIAAKTAEPAVDANGNDAKILISKDDFTIEDD